MQKGNYFRIMYARLFLCKALFSPINQERYQKRHLHGHHLHGTILSTEDTLCYIIRLIYRRHRNSSKRWKTNGGVQKREAEKGGDRG